MSNNRPTIVIVCNSYPPEIGAAPTRIYNLAQLLKGAGYEVEVVCALPNYPTGRIHPDYRGKLRVTEVLEGITVHRLALVPSASRRGLRRMVSMATQAVSLVAFLLPHLLRRRPGLVIVSSPPLPMAAAGMAVAKVARCKTLLNVSDLWPLTALELGAVKPGALLRALDGVERRMYARADAVMGQSEEILQHIAARISKPAFLYRNLPDQNALTRSIQREVSNAKYPTRSILYAGQLGPVQGIADICEAHDFSALGLQLHLYGDGPERVRIAERIAAEPGCGIILHIPVPLSEMTVLMAHHDAALVPLRRSLTGAVPSKLFAAVGAGMPVVFCGGGEGAQLVERHGLGWSISPGDDAALDGALRDLATLSAHDLATMRERCRHAALTAFSKAAQDTAFLQFLSKMF